MTTLRKLPTSRLKKKAKATNSVAFSESRVASAISYCVAARTRSASYKKLSAEERHRSHLLPRLALDSIKNMESLFLFEFFEWIQRLQRLLGSHGVGIHRFECDEHRRIWSFGRKRQQQLLLDLRTVSCRGTLLEFAQIFARSRDHSWRNARQRGDLESITLVGGSVFHAMKKNQLLAVLGGIQMNIGATVDFVCQRSEFEIVSGK